MSLEMANELLAYNTWANTVVLETAATLPPEQYARDLGGSFPSVQETLTHIMWAEWLWLERWTRGSATEVFSPQSFPSVPVLANRWREIQAAQARFVESLTTGALQQVVRYTNLKGQTWAYPLWRQMYHLVSHSGYHRGQVTNKFRRLGVMPRTTDFLTFCDEGR
jgi:uncharacterized damage-inducible protein DinB